MAESEQKPAKKGPLRRAAGATGRFLKWSVVGDTREISMIHEATRARVHRLMRPGEYARRESFMDACQRLGVSPEDVARRASELHTAARLYLGVAGTALLVFGFLPWSEHPFSHGLSSLLVLVMALTRYSVVRWRQAQCEQGQLMPYVQYWRQWWGW